MKIYLDVCCLNRLFDDPAQARIAIEAEAVLSVLQRIDQGQLTDYSSAMANVEIERTQDVVQRENVLSMLPPRERIIPMSDVLLDAAAALMRFGFQLADAVHLAAAMTWKVDVFLTVDDKLARRAARHRPKLGFRVLNPVKFIEDLDNASDR